MQKKFIFIIIAMVSCIFIGINPVKAYDMGTKNCYYSNKGERQTYYTKMTIYGIGTFAGDSVAIETYYYNNTGTPTKKAEFSVDNFDGMNYIYNYMHDYGVKFSLNAHLTIINQRINEGETDLLKDENNEVCPSNIYKISYLNKKNEKQFMFFLCNGYNSELSTDTCANVENYIKDSDYFGANPIVTKQSFTTSSGFSNVDQSDKTQTDIKDSYDNINEKIEDKCDENSPNYDAIECQNLKDQKEDLEEQAGDLSGDQLTEEDQSPEDMDQGIKSIVFCEDPGVLKVIQIIGYVLFVIKILVPLLLIILGTVDFAKATISSDDKSNKEAISSLTRRIILGVVIFIIPTILNYVLTLVDNAVETSSKFSNCTTCLLEPTKCKDYVKE